jgi:hypothetical protein
VNVAVNRPFRDGLVVWRACTTCGTRFPFAQFQIIMLIMGGIFGVGSVAAVMGKLENSDIIWFFSDDSVCPFSHELHQQVPRKTDVQASQKVGACSALA